MEQQINPVRGSGRSDTLEETKAKHKGARAKFRIHVVDSMRKPVPGVDMEVVFSGNGNFTLQQATSDGDGFCSFEGMSTSTVTFRAKKEGYYATERLHYFFVANAEYNCAKNGKWQPWDATLELVLKEIRNPIPMYARKNLLLTFPSGTEVGFDCIMGDLVAPHGEGRIADFSFTCNMSQDSTVQTNQFLLMTVQGGGFIQRPQDMFSELRSMHEAPESGYTTLAFDFKYTGSLVGSPMGGNKSDYLMFKSLRDGGKAHYGKIYQLGYGRASYTSTDSGVRIDYHFNPTPNDRNIESDPKQNFSSKPAHNDRNSMKMDKP
jgi:hypothetical protein